MIILFDLLHYSSEIVSILLIFAYIFLRNKYQWALGRFLKFILFGGVIGFVVAIAYTVIWTIATESPQGPLGIFYIGPPLTAIGELVGFALFLWVLRKKEISNIGVHPLEGSC